jgi:hypothetical protein
MFVVFLALEAFVKPFTGVITGFGFKLAFDFPVRTGLELADFLFALDDDGQRRGLDPADGSQVEAASL